MLVVRQIEEDVQLGCRLVSGQGVVLGREVAAYLYPVTAYLYLRILNSTLQLCQWL